MERHTLTDRHWVLIRDLLPANGRRGQQWKDHRLVIDGILWVLRTGAPWRAVPSCYGSWSTVYDRFRRWAREGLWNALLLRLQTSRQSKGRIDWHVCMIDGSVVRAHRVAAGARNFGRVEEPIDHALGRSRGGFSTKIHLLCDGRGLPLASGLTAGQCHEAKMLPQILARVRVAGRRGRPRERPEALAGDKAYSARWTRSWLRARRIRPIIPTRIDERRETGFDRRLYRRRNVIERLIGWLKESRRIATRYEKLALHFEAMLTLAMVLRYLRA
jgi:transposase